MKRVLLDLLTKLLQQKEGGGGMLTLDDKEGTGSWGNADIG